MELLKESLFTIKEGFFVKLKLSLRLQNALFFSLFKRVYNATRLFFVIDRASF